MNAKELQAEIERRRVALQPALREIEALERRQAEAASREFIAAHSITATQVQSSSEGGARPLQRTARPGGRREEL